MESSALNGDTMVQKGYFWPLGNNQTYVYYTFVSSKNIESYRVETLDMGMITLNNWCQWNMKI